MRRFTRLTNVFSKKAENHAHNVALHFMHYNYCRIHQTLRVTPAMQAGLTNHVWEIGNWWRYWIEKYLAVAAVLFFRLLDEILHHTLYSLCIFTHFVALGICPAAHRTSLQSFCDSLLKSFQFPLKLNWVTVIHKVYGSQLNLARCSALVR